jgi:type IV pilus assembly protein PilY1
MRRHRITKRILPLAAATAALLAPAGGGPLADDTALFANQVAPNVVLIFDNSQSMNHIVWHPAYKPELFHDGVCSTDPADPDYDENCLEYPLCPLTYNDGEFEDSATNNWSISDGGVFGTRSGTGTIVKSDNNSACNDRVVFHDPEVAGATPARDTWWTEKYLEWYFSDNVELDHDGDGRTILEEMLDTDDGVRSACVIAATGKPANYAKYKRSRVSAAKEIVREVICNTNQVAEIRYGLAKFEALSNVFDDPDGGYVVEPVADYSETHADNLEAAIADVDGESYTPLGETLYMIYRYFMSRTAGETPDGDDGSTNFPVYNRNDTGGTSGTIPGSPLTDDCQLHFVIVLTDGEPTFDDFDNMSQSTFINNLIGDYNDPGDETENPEPDGFGSIEAAYFLDDIAKFMHDVDFMPGTAFPSEQTIDVYTVGFTTTAAANSLLDRTAEAGGGEFFFSNNAEELTTALTETINEIVAKSKAFTAATVPASRSTDGNNFFTSYFTPSQDDPFWPGHLKLFDFNAKGEVLDAPPPDGTGLCALNDPQAPTRCRVGGLNLALNGFWDAGEEIPAAGSRDLYVSKYQSAAPSTIPVLPPEFTDQGAGKLTPTDLGIAGATAADIAAYDNGVPGFDLTGIDTDTELADAIVRYVRGCEFTNGSCTDRGDLRKLWDIFHSNPVVVGPPNAGIRERSYRAFVQVYEARRRIIYAGSNGGFLHGFDAGTFDTGATPPGYTRGSGAEIFGFMAYPARQQIEKLPRDLWPRGEDGWSGYSMDGSPTAADAWFYVDADDDPDDLDLGWANWRTILVGGMRQGGRAVWALDVTDPDGETGDPTMFPGYLWEFPCERSACDAWRPYMGETWSQPVVTRVQVTVDCGTDASAAGCPSYDRWVAIFGAGYDESGDPNLAHDANGTIVAGEYDGGTDADTLKAGRAIFMVDVVTGEVLGAKRFQYDGTANDPSDGEPDMQFAFASSPSVFDIDFDGYADLVVIGDLGGNLWKWMLDEPGQDHVNGSAGSDQQPRWGFRKLLAAENCTSCTPPHYKSFYFPPTGAMVGPRLYLAVGSGERNDLDFGQDGGLSTAEKNRYYVFSDKDPLDLDVGPMDPTPEPFTDVSPSTDFVDATSISNFNPNSCLTSGTVGFYIQGEDGEKFITESVIFFGVVFTTSYIPAPSTANACTASGTAYLYGFELMCGEGRFDPSSGDPDDPMERRIEIGEGLPNAPRVSVGPTDEGSGTPDDDDDPCRDMVIVITSENGGHGEGRCDRSSSGLGLESWRDL